MNYIQIPRKDDFLYLTWLLKKKLAFCYLPSPFIRLGKKHFFVNSEILGIQIWREKPVNYNGFEIATKQRKSNI